MYLRTPTLFMSIRSIYIAVHIFKQWCVHVRLVALSERADVAQYQFNNQVFNVFDVAV